MKDMKLEEKYRYLNSVLKNLANYNDKELIRICTGERVGGIHIDGSKDILVAIYGIWRTDRFYRSFYN